MFQPLHPYLVLYLPFLQQLRWFLPSLSFLNRPCPAETAGLFYADFPGEDSHSAQKTALLRRNSAVDGKSFVSIAAKLHEGKGRLMAERNQSGLAAVRIPFFCYNQKR